jgi:hypothetical protein
MSLLALPRELRDEIIGYLALPSYVYTSSDKPNTENLHRSKIAANTFVDTRIYLPCRIIPNILGVCRQLRSECLQHHRLTMNTLPSPTPPREQEAQPVSNVLAARVGTENDEEAERIGDHCLRITIEAQRPQRNTFGYAIPTRQELSPRFLSLLTQMHGSRKLRLVIWPGYDWWSGSRPRSMVRVNGKLKIDPDAPAKPDAVSFAIAKVLECLNEVEELEIDVLSHVGDMSRWYLLDTTWENIQYWLDSPIMPFTSTTNHISKNSKLKRVKRRLAGVWESKMIEASYVQEETRVEGQTWHVKRHGDMRTPTVLALADPGELEGYRKVVDEEFDRTY